MSDGPNLPVIALALGPWRAEVFDPRPDPRALGARYVHGGYVRAWWRDGRCLTARAWPAWDPYVGEGLPEVFELPLAWAPAHDGEPFLRIGAGRNVRRGRDAPSKGLPADPVEWSIAAHDSASVTMRCADEVVHAGQRHGYELARTIRLLDDGMLSMTTLRLAVPWSHPVGWFAHPFFAQSSGEATGFALPAAAQVAGAAARDAAGLWRMAPDGGLANVTGLWGSPDPIVCHLDPRQGGGRIQISLDRPLDHAVLYASPHAASPEPQLVRGWKDGEQASWAVRYRWL